MLLDLSIMGETHHVLVVWIQGFPGGSCSNSLSLIHSPPSEQRCCTPAAVWPLSRMQLWIFTPQRDNEVSSGAKNEPVVLPRGSWGLSWLPEPALCKARDIHLLLIGYRLISTILPVPAEVCHGAYLTVHSFWERVVITICWKVSYQDIRISKQTDGEQMCYRISVFLFVWC